MRRDDDMRGDERDGGRERDREARDDWKRTREGPGGKMVGAIVALIVLVLLAVQNMDEADVDLLLWDVQVPLWVTFAIAGVLGFVIGWLLGRASGKRRAIHRIRTD